MPAPADIQTANGGATIGKPETGDSVTFTFAAAVTPSLILSGWDGSGRSVTAHFDHDAIVSSLVIEESGGTPIVALGTLALNAHYTNALDFTNSTMTASGSSITVTLGSEGPGGVHTILIPSTTTWTAPTGSATESGLPDVEF